MANVPLVQGAAALLGHVLVRNDSGSPELAQDGAPRPEYAPARPLEERYAAKAAELGVGHRSVSRWVAQFRAGGEAALARSKGTSRKPQSTADERWVETALEVMVEHTGESKPSQTMVIERTRARVIARFGADVVPQPSRATAFRVLAELERQHPLFRLSTKRNRDIADRPDGVYGKLRPTRPGEYLLMDSTRVDVFAFDPFTLRWVQAELSVAMDWYTRCITGIRLTPVSTKAVDVSAVLYQFFRPRPASPDWPRAAAEPSIGRRPSRSSRRCTTGARGSVASSCHLPMSPPRSDQLSASVLAVSGAPAGVWERAPEDRHSPSPRQSECLRQVRTNVGDTLVGPPHDVPPHLRASSTSTRSKPRRSAVQGATHGRRRRRFISSPSWTINPRRA